MKCKYPHSLGSSISIVPMVNVSAGAVNHAAASRKEYIILIK